MRRISSGEGKSSPLRFLWTSIVILLVLVLSLLTIGILALRIGNTLPEGVDVIFIVPKHPGSHVEDSEDVWETNTEVEIFSSHYVNGENQTTVLSQNGDKIIAPGTVSTYQFCFYNDGNMAIKYDLAFSFHLAIDGVQSNVAAFPLSLRMKDTQEKFVMGDEENWVSIEAGTLGEYTGIVGASSYERFTLEIMWAFEGNDELDTALGNMASKSDVQLQFEIESYAEENSNPSAQGGVLVSQDAAEYDGYEFGGTIRWELFLILLALLAAGIIYIVIWRI